MKKLELILRHPKLLLVLGLAVTILSVYFSQKIKVRTNFSDLLPDDHPAVVQAQRLDRIVGGASFIVVAVETADTPSAGRFLDDLKTRLPSFQKRGIRYIDDRPPASFLRQEGLLLVSQQDLRKLFDRIKQRIDAGKLKKAGLFFDLEEPAESPEWSDFTAQYTDFLAPNPRYQNREGTLLVSLFKPAWRSTDMSRTQQFVQYLQATINELNPKTYHPSLTVRLTGPYIKVLTQKKILIRDAASVSLVSLAGAVLYLILHFRKKRAVLLIGLPLTASVAWALAVAYFLYGSLNLFSSVACAVLMGLAADYGIHMYSEYIRHRRQGASQESALRLALNHLTRPFITASTTTSAAFFALTFSRFKAFHEFGMIAGIGIILCAVAFILLFPPLVWLTERFWPLKERELKQEASLVVLPRWTGFYRALLSKRTLVVTSIFLLLPLAGIGRLTFDYNLNRILGSQPTKTLDREVDGIFNHTVNPEVALTTGFKDASILAKAFREVTDRNRTLPQGTTLKGVLSLNDFLPEDQKEKRKVIGEIKRLFTPTVVQGLSEKERESYRILKEMLDPFPITYERLPDQIKRMFQDREGQIGRMVYLFPNFDMQQADKFIQFVEEVREVQCPECSGPFYASGESTVYYEIVQMLFREGKLVIGAALLSILITLWLNFRSFRSTLLAFAPLGVGMIATIGWMAVLGIPFNIINLAALPVLLGTADDYSVHFYQRYLVHPERSLEQTYRLTSIPILGSALTTLIGFGSLLIGNMGGVRTFGLTCSLGIALSAITTLLWFPALLAWLDRRRIAS